MPDIGPTGFTFNQFLIDDEGPLLFHAGPRAMFPLVSAAIGTITRLDRLRWVTFGHLEADECGAMNLLLAAAPHAQIAHGAVGCMVSLNDLADRPPVPLPDGQVIELGRHRVQHLDTPHVPHGWDARVLFEQTTGTLLCGDLLSQVGDPPAITSDDVVEAASTISTIPSGQRTVGQSVLEPVYNDENAGHIGYIKQPEKAPQPVNANPRAWAPFYLVVYPVTSTVASTTTLLGQHSPVDNCPTHGNGIAALAIAQEPSVYGIGVAGHDHLMDFPGGPDFNIAWEPTVVLFTPKGVIDGTVNDHILRDTQIQAAIANQDVTVTELPQRTFICSSVPERLYDMATPLTP